MNQTTPLHFLKKKLPFLIGLTLFTFLLLATIKYTKYKRGLWEKDVRSALLENLIAKKSKLEQALYSRIYYTKSISAYVSIHPEISLAEFDNLAHELIDVDSVISTMSLSRDCIISAIYPQKGHEKAIGLNLLAHPERKHIVEKTIETHQTFIAGPVELIEGGLAFISYTPIFDKTTNSKNNFWGVTDIVIYKDKLLKEANLKEKESLFNYALKGYDGKGEKGELFWGKTSVFSESPVKVSIELPDGEWILAASPINGWASYPDQDKILLTVLIVSSFIISILIWLFSRAMLKIRMDEKELKAIFKSMSSLVIEMDKNGKYVKIAPTNEELLFKPREDLINKTVYEVLDKKTATLIHKAILKCLKSKELVIIEYSLEINKNENWFSARLSWKSSQTIIFQAYDFTVQKKYQQSLAASEQNLKELNATKDKFFSIIAHDLKSPFNSILGFSEILKINYEQLSIEEQKQYISTINDSSKNTVALIDNLLDWSRSERGLLKFNPKEIQLATIVNENLVRYKEAAERKNILLEMSFDKNIEVIADPDMLSTVFRNLISNAIKFTPENGRIKISTNTPKINIKDTIEIMVSDNGIGINTEDISKLFLLEKGIKNDHNHSEKGTGLGLILCKECIEKQGQKIWVESELGKGSKFIFTLDLKKQ